MKEATDLLEGWTSGRTGVVADQTRPLLSRLAELRERVFRYAPPASWQRDSAMELLRSYEELALLLIDLERVEARPAEQLRLQRTLQRAHQRFRTVEQRMRFKVDSLEGVQIAPRPVSTSRLCAPPVRCTRLPGTTRTAETRQRFRITVA